MYSNDVKIKFMSEKSKKNIIENKKTVYKRYVINDNEKYIEFIDRKNGA